MLTVIKKGYFPFWEIKMLYYNGYKNPIELHIHFQISTSNMPFWLQICMWIVVFAVIFVFEVLFDKKQHVLFLPCLQCKIW